MDLTRAIALAATLLLTGCEIYAEPAPISCPGRSQGSFQFQGTIATNGCAWASGQYNDTLAFPGSIHFDAAPSQLAWLCVEAPHAVPRAGTYAVALPGPPPVYSIDVRYVAYGAVVGNCTCPSEQARVAGGCTCPPGSLTSCSCPVVVTERVTGDMQQLAGGMRFAGTQTVTADPPPSPAPVGAGCDCQTSCSFSYTLSGVPL